MEEKKDFWDGYRQGWEENCPNVDAKRKSNNSEIYSNDWKDGYMHGCIDGRFAFSNIDQDRKEKAIEMAKSFLSLKIDIEMIATVTGLTIDEVGKIK